MRITVITDGKGEILGAVRGPCAKYSIAETSGMSVGFLPAPGQKLVELDAPDELREVGCEDLISRLKELLLKQPNKP